MSSEPIDIGKLVFGMSLEEAHKASICIDCKQHVRSFKDELSVQEYRISGLCQSCQDRAFAPLPEQDEEDDDLENVDKWFNQGEMP